MNLFNQGMGGMQSIGNAFSNNAAAATEETSSKRKMTAQESAALNQTLASTANFIQNYQNGGLNLFDSNPFLKKNKEQNV